MNNIDFESVFDLLSQPTVLISVRDEKPKFLKANSAFFDQTSLTVADLHLADDWLPAILKNHGADRGALSEFGLDALRAFAKGSHLRARNTFEHKHSMLIDGILFFKYNPELGQHYSVEDGGMMPGSDVQLSMFFNNSIFGAFFMMTDKPYSWNVETDSHEALDFLLDNLRISRVNQAMLDQYGAKREDFMGRTPHDFFEHDIQQEKRLLFEIFAKGKHRAVSFERNLKGEEVIFEGDYVVLYNHQRDIIGLFGLQQDITRRHHYIARIEEQNEKLREIAWMQSHVVRAPLARALSLLNLLDGTVDAKSKELEKLHGHLREAIEELDGVVTRIVKRTEGVDISAIAP